MDNNNSIREIVIINTGNNIIAKTTASSLDGMTWYINRVGNDNENVNKTVGLKEFIEYLKTIEGVQTVEVRTRYGSLETSELLDMEDLEGGVRIRISKEYNEDGFCCWHFYAVFTDELEVRLEDWNGDKEFISDWTRFFDAVSAIINNL